MKRLLALFVILFFAALGAGGYVAYEAYLLVFPALPPALYAGLLEPEGGDSLPFFVDSSRGPRDLWVAVGDDSMPAQRVKTEDSSGSAGLPLIATGSGTRLRLTGDERRQGEFAGKFIDPIRNQRGRWMLRRIDVPPISAPESEALQSWGAAFRDLAQAGPDASVDLTAAHTSAPDRGVADLQSDLSRDLEAFEQAARLTPHGELVRLSRDIVRREGRWIESVLALGSPETSPSFERDLERAYEVKGLLDQIAQERRLLDQAQGRDEVIDSSPEVGPEESAGSEEGAGEEEFYRDL